MKDLRCPVPFYGVWRIFLINSEKHKWLMESKICSSFMKWRVKLKIVNIHWQLQWKLPNIFVKENNCSKIFYDFAYLTTKNWCFSLSIMSCSRVFSCVFSLLLFLYNIPFYPAADTVLCFNVRNLKTNSIALENRLYQVNNFCHISARKHMLWVLIRSGSPSRFLWVPTTYIFVQK